MGASPEPLFIDAPSMSRDGMGAPIPPRLRRAHIHTAMLNTLASYFPQESEIVDRNVYHHAFEPLYAHYLATVYDTCGPFTHDPDELAYIAAARWPGFIQPVLDEHQRSSEEFEAWAEAQREAGVAEDEIAQYAPPALTTPPEDTRLRLTRLFTPSLTAALETLYPRLTNAADWARTHAPPRDLLRLPPAQALPALRVGGADQRGVDALSRMAKFVLVAAFLASTNPPKSDMRMFGRGPEERKRHRRKGGGARTTKKPGTATKVRCTHADGIVLTCMSHRSHRGSSDPSRSRLTDCSPS